jgi:pyruvate-ferredoxin/flavodoxin oxidoreductase
MMDGNEATARTAYNVCDTMFIYPITPSSPMAELSDIWATAGQKNVFGQVVSMIQMQSEAGAVAALHGSLLTGGMGTTFTSSQGLLLMIPTLYQLSAELLPGVLHVASRSVAGTGTAIGGDHTDVMGVRATGIGLLSSACPQECHDLALIAHVSAYKQRVPMIHFFDGMQVSHQVNNVEVIPREVVEKMVPKEAIYEHHRRGLNSTHPHRSGSSVSSDIYFQMTEAMNPFYQSVPNIVEQTMLDFERLTGRRYRLFEYVGAKDAEYVMVIMGAGGLTAEETVRYLNQQGERVGLIKVRLMRPWSIKHFLEVLPKTVKKIAVMDRVKEASAVGEPLYMDVSTTLMENNMGHIKVVGGRYGIAGKPFFPTHVRAIFNNLKQDQPKNHFTVGIVDDVTNSSLPPAPMFQSISPKTKQCIFFALGSDGTVGANKNAIKIIGDHTNLYAQGFFFYSAHKSGGTTVSHIRFGPEKIIAQYPINSANYIACHNKAFVHQFNVVKAIKEGGTFVLNSPWTLDQMEKMLPNKMKRIIAQRKVKFYNIDAGQIAQEMNMPGRINMIMQTVFFKLADLFSEEESIALLKQTVEKALENLIRINYPPEWANLPDEKEIISEEVPEEVKNIQQPIIRREGDFIPVSHFAPDGRTSPSTASFEKRGIAEFVPRWKPDKCTQCNVCSFVCPHSAIRPFILTEEQKKQAPLGYEVLPLRGQKTKQNYYTIQVSPLDCTGCTACTICPSKALEMVPIDQVKDVHGAYWDWSVKALKGKQEPFVEEKLTAKGTQFKEPLFEFSGACAGCGETPYMRLLTQLYGPRMIIANATGCSSVWGSYYPSNPFTVDCKNRGPAYSRALFETNAEFGLGMTITTAQRRNYLAMLIENALKNSEVPMSKELRECFNGWLQTRNDAAMSMKYTDEIDVLLKNEFKNHPQLTNIYRYSDMLLKPSHWIIGGDGNFCY